MLYLISNYKLKWNYVGLCLSVLASITPAWSAALGRQLFTGLKQAASKAQQYRSMSREFLERTKSTRELAAKKLFLCSGGLVTTGFISADFAGICAGVAGTICSWALFFPQSTAAITGGLAACYGYKKWQIARFKREILKRHIRHANKSNP